MFVTTVARSNLFSDCLSVPLLRSRELKKRLEGVCSNLARESTCTQVNLVDFPGQRSRSV